MALRRRLETLSDGSGRTLDLPPIDALLQHLDLRCAPPFVPPEAGYVGGADLPVRRFNVARAEAILDINCHGGELQGLKKPRNIAELTRYMTESPKSDFPEGKLRLENTVLYPAVALLNHSSDPNTLLIPIGPDGVSMTAVFASRELAPGEEITISYSKNPEVLRGKWGITNS